MGTRPTHAHMIQQYGEDTQVVSTNSSMIPNNMKETHRQASQAQAPTLTPNTPHRPQHMTHQLHLQSGLKGHQEEEQQSEHQSKTRGGGRAKKRREGACSDSAGLARRKVRNTESSGASRAT
jgi:hypothetical protein